MKKGKIYIGTSGWNYKHWKKNFYPEDIKQKDWLKFYSEKFDTVEINNSFYRLPEKKTFKNWKDTVSKNFVFSVKASRYITHMKKLKDPKESVSNFIDNSKSLKEKLGPILFQLPPNWKFNKKRFQNFLKKLSKKYNYTMEFRNSTWWNDDVFKLLKKNNIAFCIYELENTTTPKKITADFVYVRLHGPDGKYKGIYNKKALSYWAKLFNKWLSNKKDIFCYFDNDEKGFAAKNALQLKNLI